MQKVHDEYVTRFIKYCEQMEYKFFDERDTQYICGDKPSFIDYVYYQEFVSAMVLSGEGTQYELFTDEPDLDRSKVDNLIEWYRAMSQDKYSKKLADQFIGEIKD